MFNYWLLSSQFMPQFVGHFFFTPTNVVDAAICLCKKKEVSFVVDAAICLYSSKVQKRSTWNMLIDMIQRADMNHNFGYSAGQLLVVTVAAWSWILQWPKEQDENHRTCMDTSIVLYEPLTLHNIRIPLSPFAPPLVFQWQVNSLWVVQRIHWLMVHICKSVDKDKQFVLPQEPCILLELIL